MYWFCNNKKLRLRASLSCFTEKATFYGVPIRNRRWIASDQSYDISAMKTSIKLKVWGAIYNSGQNYLHFYKEKTNDDVYVNIQ